MKAITEKRTVAKVGTRRYLVDRSDEHLFDALVTGGTAEDVFGHMGAILTSFGGQWLRARNTVDEMYRTLSMCEVVSATRKSITVNWPS